jgi:hypothetical protein
MSNGAVQDERKLSDRYDEESKERDAKREK